MLWNTIVFSLYGIDKWKAVHKQYRISERTLLLSTLICGGLGSLLGMVVFHHKTRKKRFWFVTIISLAILFYI